MSLTETKTMFDVRHFAQLANKFDTIGWGTSRVTQLGQANEEQYRDIEALLDGRATVTINCRLTTPVTLTLQAIKNPEYLKDLDGVHLWSNAAALFNGVSKLPAQPKRKVARADLVEKINDFEIIANLGDEEAVVHDSVEELQTTINQLIAEQADGKSGDLLNDGKANIFYVRDPQNSERVLYVDVNWYSAAREWLVNSHEVASDQWDAGLRVFLATAA